MGLLSWPEWKVEANKRYVKGQYTGSHATKDLGWPKDMNSADWKIEFDKGKVKRKVRSTARANKKVSEKTRRRWLKKSNEHLTPEELKAGKLLKKENKKYGAETDHDTELQESGPILDDIDEREASGKITSKQAEAERKKLRDRGIGDDPVNLVPLPGDKNREKATAVQRKRRELQQNLAFELQKRNPETVNIIKTLLTSSASRRAAWTLGKQVAGHAAFWLNLFTRGLSLGGGLASADGADEYRYPTDHALDTDKKIMEMLEEAELDEIPLDTA